MQYIKALNRKSYTFDFYKNKLRNILTFLQQQRKKNCIFFFDFLIRLSLINKKVNEISLQENLLQVYTAKNKEEIFRF